MGLHITIARVRIVYDMILAVVLYSRRDAIVAYIFVRTHFINRSILTFALIVFSHVFMLI